MAEMLEFSAPYLSDVEKSCRNPPDIEKRNRISRILNLSDEKNTMFDLAGKMRETVAPALPEYIMDREYVLVPCVLRGI